MTPAPDPKRSLIRRPDSTVPTARAADTMQPHPGTQASGAMVRTGMQIPLALRAALKTRAVRQHTTMTYLICHAVSSTLADTAQLTAIAPKYHRLSGAPRTTLNLPAELHVSLKLLAAQHNSTIQALVLAALDITYPTS